MIVMGQVVFLEGKVLEWDNPARITYSPNAQTVKIISSFSLADTYQHWLVFYPFYCKLVV